MEHKLALEVENVNVNLKYSAVYCLGLYIYSMYVRARMCTYAAALLSQSVRSSPFHLLQRLFPLRHSWLKFCPSCSSGNPRCLCSSHAGYEGCQLLASVSLRFRKCKAAI